MGWRVKKRDNTSIRPLKTEVSWVRKKGRERDTVSIKDP